MILSTKIVQIIFDRLENMAIRIGEIKKKTQKKRKKYTKKDDPTFQTEILFNRYPART